MKLIILLLLACTCINAFPRGGGGGSSSNGNKGSSSKITPYQGKYPTRGGSGRTIDNGLISTTTVSYSRAYRPTSSVYIINHYPWFPWLFIVAHGPRRNYTETVPVCSDIQLNETYNCYSNYSINTTDCDNTPSLVVEIIDTCFPRCNNTELDINFIADMANISSELNQTCGITIENVLSDVGTDTYTSDIKLVMAIVFGTLGGIFVIVIIAYGCAITDKRNDRGLYELRPKLPQRPEHRLDLT